jgi:GNAT superfamily N-acetyltransferase
MVKTTYLEMLSVDELVSRPTVDPGLCVREITEHQWQISEFYYKAVGKQWQWCDRLKWTDIQWRDHIETGGLRTFVVTDKGADAGYFDLGRDGNASVEIVNLGLLPAFIGRHLGGALVTAALRQAWAWDAQRVWLHTCTHDHPRALDNYCKSGLRIFKTEED